LITDILNAGQHPTLKPLIARKKATTFEYDALHNRFPGAFQLHEINNDLDRHYLAVFVIELIT
jgi:hypothetical protein